MINGYLRSNWYPLLDNCCVFRSCNNVWQIVGTKEIVGEWMNEWMTEKGLPHQKSCQSTWSLPTTTRKCGRSSGVPASPGGWGWAVRGGEGVGCAPFNPGSGSSLAPQFLEPAGSRASLVGGASSGRAEPSGRLAGAVLEGSAPARVGEPHPGLHWAAG